MNELPQESVSDSPTPTMAEVLEHIERSPLPWRIERFTECGRAVNDVKAVISRDEAIRKFDTQGGRRAALSTCMSCVDTTNRWPTFDENPVARINRETYMGRRNTEALFAQELRALALLLDNHREEFDALMVSLAETPQLDTQRQRKAGRRYYGRSSR